MPRPTGTEVDRIVREVLARDELDGLDQKGGSEVEAFGELVTALMQTADALIGELRSNHPEVFVLILIAGTAVLSAAIWYGAKGAARRSYADARAPDPIPAVLEGDPARLRSDAARRAEEGDFLGAVRSAFRARIIEQALAEGTLESLRDAGRFRRARTYRELVDEFSRSSDAYAAMGAIAERIERGLYAEEPLGRDDWERARSVLR
jgi:hypothetical protein